tara:strand:- start:40 stop:1083 length:1044 start_codon:yes stop_codon:yes gene_type:complete
MINPNTLLKIKPTTIKKVAGIFKPGLKSKLVQQLKRTTQQTAGGKLRVFQKGKTKEIYGSKRAVQEGLFQHTEDTLKATGKRTTTGYGNVNVRDASKVTGFKQGKPNIRGGLKNLDDPLKIGFKDKVLNKAQNAVRKARQIDQTVQPDRILAKGYQTKGGHHHLGLDMGDAITDGLKRSEKNPFWEAMEGKYKNIFSGDHWANMRYLPEGKPYAHLVDEKTASVHKQVHSQLRKYGLDVKSLKKMFKGKNVAERAELMGKIDHKMKKMDQWIFLRMKKWKGGEEAFFENLKAFDDVNKKFPNMSKAKRRLKIKELLQERRDKVSAETQSVADLFIQPLDAASIKSIK